MPAVKILVIDNYDSFVYNLVQYLAQIGAEVDVWRNDDSRFADPRFRRRLRRHSALAGSGYARRRQGYVSMWSEPMRAGCRSSASASGCRPSASRTGAWSIERPELLARQDLAHST